MRGHQGCCPWSEQTWPGPACSCSGCTPRSAEQSPGAPTSGQQSHREGGDQGGSDQGGTNDVLLSVGGRQSLRTYGQASSPGSQRGSPKVSVGKTLETGSGHTEFPSPVWWETLHRREQQHLWPLGAGELSVGGPPRDIEANLCCSATAPGAAVGFWKRPLARVEGGTGQTS